MTWQQEGLPLYEGVDWNAIRKSRPASMMNVSLFTREWIEIAQRGRQKIVHDVSLFTREWIEIDDRYLPWLIFAVSLFTREWIEICHFTYGNAVLFVSLFTREWIEIRYHAGDLRIFARLPLYEGVDWNSYNIQPCTIQLRLPLYEGVDWNSGCNSYRNGRWRSPSLRGSGLKYFFDNFGYKSNMCVSLFTREWIEIKIYK